MSRLEGSVRVGNGLSRYLRCSGRKKSSLRDLSGAGNGRDRRMTRRNFEKDKSSKVRSEVYARQMFSLEFSVVNSDGNPHGSVVTPVSGWPEWSRLAIGM